MGKKVSIVSVVKFAGAFIAYLMGSGFASGQELMQFFTAYGIKSVIAVAVAAVFFAWVGASAMADGYDHNKVEGYRPYVEVCGKYLGRFFEVAVYFYLFMIITVMISGAGATLSEYFSVSHYIGSLLMALIVFVATAVGIKGIINTVGTIGPIVVTLTIAVGIITLIRYAPALANADSDLAAFAMRTPTSTALGGGFLYASYNLMCAIAFFTALGARAQSRKEAVLGGILGAVLLILAILMMNLAFLSRIKDVGALEIPTLFLASEISPVFGALFLGSLFSAIFCTSAPMAWSLTDKLSPVGCTKKRRLATAAIIIAAAALAGLLPFAKLISIVYPISGYLGMLYILCLAVYKIRKRIAVSKAKRADAV